MSTPRSCPSSEYQPDVTTAVAVWHLSLCSVCCDTVVPSLDAQGSSLLVGHLNITRRSIKVCWLFKLSIFLVFALLEN